MKFFAALRSWWDELCHLDAGDFLNDDENPFILARETKGGKPRVTPLTPEGAQLFEDLPAGKNSGKPVFTREDGSRWGKSHQHRPMLEACTKADIKPVISFYILRHTYAAGLAREGVPLQFIAAALGHSNTRITEKFYAHLAPSHVADVIRANLPTLGIQTGDVHALVARRASRRASRWRALH